MFFYIFSNLFYECGIYVLFTYNEFWFYVVEAHRGVGNYAYCFISNEISKINNFYTLCLSASPGSDMEKIEEVFSNFFIDHTEIKKENDKDIKSYINETKIEKIEVELDSFQNEIKNDLQKTLKNRIDELKYFNFVNQNQNTLTKTEILNLQGFLRSQLQVKKSNDLFDAISISSGIMKLIHGIELFETQDFQVCFGYFLNFFKKNETRAVLEISRNIHFRNAIDKIEMLHKNNTNHPKIEKLKLLVKEQVERNKNLKIIIFSSYREIAKKIEKQINQIENIKSSIFVGQSKKNEVNFSQKKQKEIIQKFRDGELNVIISTSVGEEGLDIPQVDLVIFYEPTPSAIRTIQRIGRTGRFSKGHVLMLITKYTRDQINTYVSNKKEKKMYVCLEKIKKKFEKNSNKDTNGLKKFFNNNKDNTEKNNTKYIELSNEDFSYIEKNLELRK